MLLKDDTITTAKVSNMLKNIPLNLKNVESSEAVELCEWLIKESTYKNQHHYKQPFPPLPPKMKRGDIIWVDFGINIGDEFSDHGKNGHYAMIWNQQGYVFTVLPLTSDGKKFINDYSINIGNIPELPLSGDTYLKLDMIRSIHIRRIRTIASLKDGKVTVSDESIINRIKLKIIEKYIL